MAWQLAALVRWLVVSPVVPSEGKVMAAPLSYLVTCHDLPVDIHRAIRKTRSAFSKTASRVGKPIPQDAATAGDEPAPSIAAFACPERQITGTAFGLYQPFLPHHA